MRKIKLLTSVVSLALLASACNNPPAPRAASHPPAVDLRCSAEPNAPTEAEALADVDGAGEEAFNDGVLIAGRSCRDALGRVCAWHRERGGRDLVCTPIRPEIDDR